MPAQAVTRFETKPNTVATLPPAIVWGPWRQPVHIVSITATLVEVALPGARVPRIQILNVASQVQQFFASGTDIVSAAGDNIRLITAFFGAGMSCIYDHTGTELDTGYWQVPIPEELIIQPGYTLSLEIDGDQTGDFMQGAVLCLHDVPVFREE